MTTPRPEQAHSKAPEHFALHRVENNPQALSADRHVDILREAGIVRDASANQSSYKVIADAFAAGTAGRYTVEELAKAGVFNASKMVDEGQERRPEDVKGLVIRHAGDAKPGDKPAHFRIKADGTIEQLRNPDKTKGEGDDQIIVEMEQQWNVDVAQMRANFERQKAAARQMINYLEARYARAKMSPQIPADLFRALYDEPQIPSPPSRMGSSGYNGHRMHSPRMEMPPMPSGGYEPQTVGRSPATDVAEQQAFQQMGPMGDIKDSEGLKSFIDRVVAAVGANEGSFTSVNWNDNGHGISVGKAGFNQEVGEMPTLLKRFHQANPDLFNRVFGNDAQNMLNEKFVRGTPITKGSDLGNKIQEALKQPEFQQVQTEMMREKVLRALQLSTKYGHTSELFVAEVADMGNQFGWGGVESCLRKANVANIRDERAAISALTDAGQDRWARRSGRDTRLAKAFSPDVQATA